MTSALQPAAAARLLQSAGAMIRAELSALPEPALVFHPAPGEWCVKEVLGHLIESEGRGFAGRIRFILAAGDRAGAGLALEGWDQEVVARERNDCARDGAALVDEFDRIRADSVKLAAGLSAADLARGGSHRVGFLTVRDLLHEWVHHDRNHLRQMLANVQAYAWPHMGNAKRFSAT
ncbi:MAG TPA: DinB family protein [Methylomirabilota bacterium]